PGDAVMPRRGWNAAGLALCGALGCAATSAAKAPAPAPARAASVTAPPAAATAARGETASVTELKAGATLGTDGAPGVVTLELAAEDIATFKSPIHAMTV